MHTNWCVLIEISMEIGMLNFWLPLLVTALTKENYFSLFLGESTVCQLAYSFIQPLLKYIVMKQPEEMHHWIEDNIFFTSVIILRHSVEIYQAKRHHFFRIWVRKLFFKDAVHLFPVGIRSCVCQNQHHSQLPYINHSVYKPNRRKRPHFLFFYCLLPSMY